MRVQIRIELDSDLAPESIREAVLDFTPRRLELWPHLDPESFTVHRVGETTALVTEGCSAPKVWSVELYDWSDPERIRWTTQESNFCTPGSALVLEIAKHLEGGSHLVLTWDRSPSNWRGRCLVFGAVADGRRMLTWGMRRSLATIGDVLGR